MGNGRPDPVAFLLPLPLFKAQEMLAVVTRLQSSGYHAAYINSLEELMTFARDIDAATFDLISSIESSRVSTSENAG